MIIERDPPLARNEIIETQLRMLQRCKVPSLLPLELEECDGRVSLRYALTGTRMLTEAMRASWWSMSEAMEALCKLADTLEECRLIMLDAERVRLQDEFIFVGNETRDLHFTYLPLVLPSPNWKEDLESLIVRWMMRVKEPDGLVFPQVLRLVSSADFVPATLSRLGRKYLAEASAGAAVSFSDIRKPDPAPMTDMRSAAREENKPKSRSWELLQPVSGDPQPVSELWGEPSQHRFDAVRQKSEENSEEEDGGERFDPARWRIIVICSSLLLLAAAWKFVYLERPGQQQLLICVCLTLIAGAAAILFWNGPPMRLGSFRRGEPSSEPGPREIEAAFRNRYAAEEASGVGPVWSPPGFAAAAAKPQERDTGGRIPGSGTITPETTWISGQERTALLDRQSSPASEPYCLVWKSKHEQFRIPLRGESLVIGRSEEAADHVDETEGISRSHVEFVKVSEQWKVKDLGSRNGSRLNNKPMAPYELYSLQPGDCLTLACSQYRFQLVEGKQPN